MIDTEGIPTSLLVSRRMYGGCQVTTMVRVARCPLNPGLMKRQALGSIRHFLGERLIVLFTLEHFSTKGTGSISAVVRLEVT